jgi:hypothetical protein
VYGQTIFFFLSSTIVLLKLTFRSSWILMTINLQAHETMLGWKDNGSCYNSWNVLGSWEL